MELPYLWIKRSSWYGLTGTLDTAYVVSIAESYVFLTKEQT